MEPNIADLLKDAFSEIDIDFGDNQSDEGPNTSQTQPAAEKDMDVLNGDSKLLTPSEQGSLDTFTNVYEQEESEEGSDSSESELTDVFTINTESTFCLSHETNNDEVVNMMMSEAPLNCTAEEEGNMQSDLTAGVSPHGLVTEFSTTEDEMQLVEEEHMETCDEEYQLKTSPSTSSDSQTSEETSSETDEELPENSNTTEQSSHCQSVDTKDDPFLAMNPNTAYKCYIRDDMKEFTEEDQEQIEESLADYPSDLSLSETEEPAENATAQPVDLSSNDECSIDRMEDLSNAEHENFQNNDSPALDLNSGVKDLEVEITSASENLDVSFQKGTFDEEDVQECLSNDRNTEDDGKCSEDEQELSDINDQAAYSSSDDHSTSEDEQNFISSVKQEEETNHVTHHDYTMEDMVRMDNEIDYIIPDTMDRDSNNLEIQNLQDLSSDVEERGFTNTNFILHYEEFNTEPTESHSRIDSGQSDTAMNDSDRLFSEALYDVGDARNIIPEALWSSALLMDEDNLCLDEYDWDLTGEDSFKISPGNGENQQYTEEEALEDLGIDDDDDDEERNDRDWELEKTRIEAFYRFYGDQTEPEDKSGRNHKVTFHLEHESSECDDEDSDRETAYLPDCTSSSSHSTEEESDSDLNTPDLTTLKPEYHSESDDPLERPYYPERSKMQPKEEEPVTAGVKQRPHRNKCLAVLKTTLAFGLLTAIGVVSFCWVTDNLDWIH